MKKNLFSGLVLILVSIFFASCSEDTVVPMSSIKLSCNSPKDLTDIEISGMTVSLKNNSTGEMNKQDFVKSQSIKLEEGMYTIILEGDISYMSTGIGEEPVQRTSKLKGLKENVNVSGKEVLINIDLFLSSDSNGFIFSEIFFAGTQTPNGSQYNSDKFFEIYNNSDQVLYADGLCISETAFLSAQKNDYMPNIMDEFVAVDVIYTIPGSGKDYPVQAGETILIADVAKNHTEDNANSFDLSKADFEWFDDDQFGIDVDVPSVPNLIKTYSSSKSVWAVHNRGFKSFILFKMDKSADEFLAANKYDYYYNFVYSSGTIKMENSAYKIPNSIVLDAVGSSAPSKFEWLVMDPSLDMSYTHSGDADGERYGKSVRRKISHSDTGGRIVLMDTNNSAFDFIPTAVPNPGVITE
jgi:hypothetical protein